MLLGQSLGAPLRGARNSLFAANVMDIKSFAAVTKWSFCAVTKSGPEIP